MPIFTRIDYPFDIRDSLRRAHYMEKREFYKERIVESDDSQYGGFTLKVESIEAGRMIALQDELCGAFLTFKAKDVSGSARRVIVDGSGIGIVEPFSRASRSIGEQLLKMDGYTHYFLPRGSNSTVFLKNSARDAMKIYSLSGEEVWPVSRSALAMEMAAINQEKDRAGAAQKAEPQSPSQKAKIYLVKKTELRPVPVNDCA